MVEAEEVISAKAKEDQSVGISKVNQTFGKKTKTLNGPVPHTQWVFSLIFPKSPSRDMVSLFNTAYLLYLPQALLLNLNNIISDFFLHKTLSRLKLMPFKHMNLALAQKCRK